MNFTLAKVKESNTDRFVLQSDNKYFSINELLFEILSEYKINPDYGTISSSINKKFHQNDLTSREFIENSIDQVKKMIEDSAKKSDKKTYIHNKFNILKDSAGDRVYSVLSFLFKKNLFYIAFLLLFAISFTFFFVNNIGIIESLVHFQENFTWVNMILYYFIFFFIIFLHEIGHATASYSFGAKPKEIGFGLYFIFPVMYTNTTNAWKLDKTKRIIVNLGGIYVQLIVNLLLIVLYYFSPFKDFTLSLLIMNTASIITSFNPFFRYDGYWIFSDYFQIQNLREKSTNLVNDLMKNPHKTFIKAQKSLFIYSVANVFFWAYVYFAVGKYIILKFSSLTEIIGTGNFLSFDFLKISFSMAFVLLGMLNLLKKIITLKK